LIKYTTTQEIKVFQMILETPHNDLFFPDDSQSRILKVSFAEKYPLSILVADDDYINQKLIGRILIKLGFQLALASDGNQVFELLKKKCYNVIFMDVQMPEMNGFEATQLIRKLLIEQPYIIAMTANSMPRDKNKCLNVGMNNYIAKPMRLAEIIEILKNAAAYVTEKNIACWLTETYKTIVIHNHIKNSAEMRCFFID
jgi:CheY-like chemotaxis protein